MDSRRAGQAIVGIVVLAGFYGLSRVSYLLFHTFVEMAGLVVAFGIFMLAWNLRRKLESPYLLMLGVASLFLGLMGLLHTLAYKGMGVFPGGGADLPTQLWIAGQYLQGLTLLIAPFYAARLVRTRGLMIGYGAATVLLLAAVFGGVFPACYVDGLGLTAFKKGSEYVVLVLMLGGLGALWWKRSAFDPRVVRQLMVAVALTAAAELLFTLYIGVYDVVNMTGHLLRLLATYVFYLAMVETSLVRPFDMLFRNLKQSEESLEQERNFVAGVLNSAGAPMLVTDAQGRIVRFNQACEDLFGYSTAEVVGQVLWEQLVPPGEVESVKAVYLSLVAGRPAEAHESHCLTRSGETRLVAWSNTTLRRPDGSVAFVISTGNDITDRRHMEEALKTREERLRMMVESVQTGMLLIDRSTHRIVNANPAASGLIGLAADQIAGRPCRDFIRCAGAGGTCPLDGGQDLNTEPVLLTANGRQVPIHRTAVPVVSDGKEHLLESFMDMTHHKQLEEELRALSMLDELTGLYNRRGFLALAEKEMETSLRLRGSLTLLFIDLKGLKEINEAWGHAEGDRALVALGRVLREAFQDTGLVGRIGGDEFAVLVPQFAGPSPARLITRLYDHLESYNSSVRMPYELQVNAGSSRFNPDHPCTVYDLLHQADTALYAERRRRALT